MKTLNVRRIAKTTALGLLALFAVLTLSLIHI